MKYVVACAASLGFGILGAVLFSPVELSPPQFLWLVCAAGYSGYSIPDTVLWLADLWQRAHCAER